MLRKGISQLGYSLVGVTLAFSLSACATGPKADGGAVGQLIRDASNPGAVEIKKNSVVASPGSIEVWGQKLKNSSFDYPVIVNPKVEQWITYFTGKGRRYFEKYLERGRYFIPEIAKVLKAHNMPQDLVYLAMIESGFNNSAKSRAKAVGPWQFIRPTGVRYGMVVDYWQDERRDTHKATLAAIKYLSELYQEFGSWELASAGYNAGENKVRRAIAKYRVHDFWEISKHRFFRPETRDYVPKIMAAAIITKNPEQFGFADPFGKLHHGKTMVNPTLNLVAARGEPGVENLHEPTPKELGEPLAKAEETVEDPADQDPEGLSNALAGEEDSDDDETTADSAAMLSTGPNPVMTPSIYQVANPKEQILEFEVKGPADLFAISKASGLPFSTIKLLNPELLCWCTPPQLKTYRVKLPGSVKSRFLSTYNDDSFDRRVVFMNYTVRKGDTIKTIARRFGIYETDPIKELNKASVNSMRVGSQISLPVPTGYKRVIASMYDEKPMPARKHRSRRSKRHRKHLSASATSHQRLAPKFDRVAKD